MGYKLLILSLCQKQKKKEKRNKKQFNGYISHFKKHQRPWQNPKTTKSRLHSDRNGDYNSLSSAPLNTDKTHVSFSELNHPLLRFPRKPAVNPLGSCNGILCLSGYDSSQRTVFLYNPFTNSRRLLPPNNSLPVLDSSKDCLVFGFGYDSGSHDYKVLCLHQSYNKGTGVISRYASVYGLRTDTWEPVEDNVGYFLQDTNGVLVGEKLHFIVVRDWGVKLKPVAVLKCFHLRTEGFYVMELPRYDTKEFDNVSLVLGELGGCLCVAVNLQFRDRTVKVEDLMDEMNSRRLGRADVWVMKEYGREESWVKLFSIRQPKKIECFLHIRAVAYSKDREKVLIDLDGFKFGWYDLKRKKFDRVTAVGAPPDDTPFTPCCLGESLVSVDREKNDKDCLCAGFKLRL